MTDEQPSRRPRNLLFIENSRGLGGSTVSLCNLLTHLDREAFRPFVVLSRPEQQEYFRRFDAALGPSVVIPTRKRLALTNSLRRSFTALAKVLPMVGRPLLSMLALLDHLVLTVPYVLRLRSIARIHAIECIHQNNGFDLAAVLVGRLLSLPLIAYQRGDEWNSRSVRYFSRFVDRFVANSEATKASLRDLQIEPGRIAVIYPPIDFARFDGEGSCAAQRAEFGVTDADRCIGIIGSLRERKGQAVFLRAAARVLQVLPTCRAFIIGEAGPRDVGYREELVSLARELGIAERVVFTGFRSDVGALIRLLDVVVHASVQPEPFGRVIVEAMAMKKPVVAARAGGPLEIIEDGRNGFLVTPGDDAQLAETVVRLLRDPAMAAAIADRGYITAKRRFSAPAHAEAMQVLYEEALARHSKTPAAPAGVGGRC